MHHERPLGVLYPKKETEVNWKIPDPIEQPASAGTGDDDRVRQQMEFSRPRQADGLCYILDD